VNLAARLETMTRHLPTSILVDAPTAQAIRASLGPDVCRVRRLARVIPVGLSTPIEVSELLPPVAECPELNDEQLRLYENALGAFEAGDWNRAEELLAKVPHSDRVKDVLLRFILDHDGAPPADWDGAIRMSAK
jgi:adenylate cyclase